MIFIMFGIVPCIIFLISVLIFFLYFFSIINFPLNIRHASVIISSILPIYLIIYLFILNKKKIITPLFLKITLSLVLIPSIAFLIVFICIYFFLEL
jgi:hypothetical protein